MIKELSANDYNALKADVIARLRALRGDSAAWRAVDETDSLVGDSRLRTYIDGCIDAPEAHNLYELLAIPRFFAFIGKYLYFPEMVARVIRFAEALPQPTAKGRVYVKMSAVQVFQYANIYGFYTQQAKRVIREALLFVPRKYGKTTTASVMALYDVLFGDADAEAYITSNSLDQSRICFGMVRKIVKTFLELLILLILVMKK